MIMKAKIVHQKDVTQVSQEKALWVKNVQPYNFYCIVMVLEFRIVKDNNGAATLVGVVSGGFPALSGYPTAYSGS